MEDFENCGPDLGPIDVDTIKGLDGSIYERVMYPNGHIDMRVVRPPMYPPSYSNQLRASDTNTYTGLTASSWNMSDYAEIRKLFEDKEEDNVEVIRKQSPVKGEHIVACCNEKDLSVENVLKTLSAVKGKLMLDIVPLRIKTIECSITPQVRRNIITASKRLKMYGKKRPIIARFDEYGNRLPDEIDLGSANGITLKIVDPEEYGLYYFELKGIEFSDNMYPSHEITRNAYIIDPDDLPF